MWTDIISNCIEDRRDLLRPVTLELLSTIPYEPDWLYWLEYIKVEVN